MYQSLAVVLLSFCWIVPSAAYSQTKRQIKKVFDSWDKNGDQKLSRDELPVPLRGNFDRVDTNGDGFISREEDDAFRTGNRRRGNRQERGRAALPEGVRKITDVSYVAGGHARQKLDLYYFPSQGPKPKMKPLVIWIHGGGWRAGSKDRCPAMFLLKKGYAVASINYRLSQHAVFPAQIRDCQSAVRWLRANCKKYSLDPGRFGVWGSSAGGHLSALLGTSGDSNAFDDQQRADRLSCKVQAVCDWFGPTDFLQMNRQAGKDGAIDHDAESSPESRLIGGRLQANPEKAKFANPITYVSKSDPPFLIVHGDSDRLVNVQQSRLLHQALEKQGVESTLVVIKGAGHGRFDQAKVHPQVVQFFDKHLKADPKLIGSRAGIQKKE